MKYYFRILPETISLNEAYENLKNATNAQKLVHISNLSFTQYSWAPDNKIEKISTTNDDIRYDEFIDCPETFEEFRDKFPKSGWHYGYIDDED